MSELNETDIRILREHLQGGCSLEGGKNCHLLHMLPRLLAEREILQRQLLEAGNMLVSIVAAAKQSPSLMQKASEQILAKWRELGIVKASQ